MGCVVVAANNQVIQIGGPTVPARSSFSDWWIIPLADDRQLQSKAGILKNPLNSIPLMVSTGISILGHRT
jgi:hypothetical protein